MTIAGTNDDESDEPASEGESDDESSPPSGPKPYHRTDYRHMFARLRRSQR